MPTRYITTDTALTSVADAIRSKGGTSEPLVYPSGFVSAINNIQTGSNGPVVEKDVNFIDYDGTLLYSYTKEEIQAMTNENQLPANPTHTGLTAQGWNWTLAQIKAQLTAMPTQPVFVGQMYVTASGDTEIDIEINDDVLLDPSLALCVNGTVTIDWGDNTTLDTVTGTSITTKKETKHTYTNTGNYTIKIHVTDGAFTPCGATTNTFLRKYNTSAISDSRSYACCVKNIRLGNGITSIGNYAFYYCFKLRTITIPSSVTSIGNSVFYFCRLLLYAVIPSGITDINSDLFNNCYSLKYSSLPSSVTSIASNAFSSCRSLSNITLPSLLTSIQSNAFSNCYFIKNVVIPSTVTSIGSSAFSYCYNLLNVTFLNGITGIESYAFSNCASLICVSLPNSITSIGINAFANCSNLSEVILPNELTSINDSTFSSCNSLISITIPSSVTSIGKTAFASCYSLASITIPSDVTNIGDSAFSSCYTIQKYHITPTTVPTAGTTIFSSIKSYTVIYVPAGKLEVYQAANGWSTYASYMQEEPAS